MAISTSSELLDWLAQNQFLSASQVEEIGPFVPTYPDARAFAAELIRRDWLTPYQGNQILTGKESQLILGNYRLRERIGEGAMGQIYKAWTLKLERVVAVKTLNKDLVKSSKALQRFQREVEAAAVLQHPNIARVYDADEIDGRPFLVMEFIDGVNLSQRVKQGGALPIAEAVEFARQTAIGLQHALERGVVHRDIKPANLMVTTAKTGGDGVPLVKILDFGLARYESERDAGNQLTQVGTMLGTIDYVAPEQAQSSRTADIRADIYALGATLFFLLTARPPFLGSTVVEKLGPRVTGEPPRVREVRPEIDPGLEAVLLRMMARLPNERFQTPIEAAEALAPFTGGGGVPQAVAVTAPAAGVVMALPVAPGAVMAGGIPMAQPVMAVPVAPPLAAPVAAGSPAPQPTNARRPFPAKLAVIAGGILIINIALLLGFCLYRYYPQGNDKTPTVLRIDKAKWSMPDEVAIPGRPHAVLVWIERVTCKGTVTVTLKDLPDGVTANTLTLPPNGKAGQFSFIVSHGTDPLTAKVKVFAECEDGAIAEMPMKLTVGRVKR